MKVLFVVASYLVGAIPTGYLLIKIFSRKDIRNIGSGSTGATNVLRYAGWRIAIPVMIFDLFKGFLPAYIASRVLNAPNLALIGVLAATIGHCYPVYIKFRGGKGVATSAGGFLYLAPLPLIISLSLTLLLLLFFRYVSLATLIGFSLLPLWILLLERNQKLFILSLIMLMIILIRHKDNIRRLVAGTERKFGERIND